MWAGALEAATKWEKLICFLAEAALRSVGTGYDVEPLKNELDRLCWKTSHTLKEMGVESPKTFPSELDIDYEEDSVNLWGLLEKNSYSSLIYKIYQSFTTLYRFYAEYVYELVFNDELDLGETVGNNINASLLELAATKIDIDEVQDFATKFREFRHRITNSYEEWINVVKERAFHAGIPLRAELLDLVYESGKKFDLGTEAESPRISTSRLHPDIYMDELLRGMRMIHRVLPAIMKKLGISDEFKLN